MNLLPLLDPQEHKELELVVGRLLTNDEAQMLRRERVLAAAFSDWFEARLVVTYGRKAGAVQPTK